MPSAEPVCQLHVNLERYGGLLVHWAAAAEGTFTANGTSLHSNFQASTAL